MSLLERLHALKDRLATREDKDLSELVQILIDGFAESEMVVEEKAAEVGSGSTGTAGVGEGVGPAEPSEGSQGFLKMEEAAGERGGEA